MSSAQRPTDLRRIECVLLDRYPADDECFTWLNQGEIEIRGGKQRWQRCREGLRDIRRTLLVIPGRYSAVLTGSEVRKCNLKASLTITVLEASCCMDHLAARIVLQGLHGWRGGGRTTKAARRRRSQTELTDEIKCTRKERCLSRHRALYPRAFELHNRDLSCRGRGQFLATPRKRAGDS